jgi:hypothetical protein
MASKLYKHTFTCLLLFIFHCQICNSQNNLSFSRVILLTDTATVPNGKVWKVESILQGTSSSWQTVTSGNNSYFSICGFIINGQYNSAINYYRLFSNYSGGNGASQSATSTGFQGTSLPIWLPSGTNIGPAINSNGISIIEYGITPM